MPFRKAFVFAPSRFSFRDVRFINYPFTFWEYCIEGSSLIWLESRNKKNTRKKMYLEYNKDKHNHRREGIRLDRMQKNTRKCTYNTTRIDMSTRAWFSSTHPLSMNFKKQKASEKKTDFCFYKFCTGLGVINIATKSKER